MKESQHIQSLKISETKLDAINVEKYLNEIVRIHKSAYHSNHFTSLFGRVTLEEYYRYLILLNDYCFVYHDIYEKMVGFIIAGYKTTEGLNNFVFQNRFFLIKILIKHPEFLFKKLIIKLNTVYSK